jgi:holo-[acyl-carrier protein] synthase
MIVGIGIDLTDIGKISESIRTDVFLRKVFTPTEIEDCLKSGNPAERFAGKFAAKEACMKALGHGIRQEVWFTQIEVMNDENGAPGIRANGNAEKLMIAKKVEKVHVSITHTNGIAAAVLILEGGA